MTHKTLPATLYDAGTDNGLTFTSPNWETSPRGVVTKITNTSPNHPAASFYYPELNKLPLIARYSFRKIQEFNTDQLKSDYCGKNNNNKNENIKTTNEDNKKEEKDNKADDFVTITTFDVTIKHPLFEDKMKVEQSKNTGIP